MSRAATLAICCSAPIGLIALVLCAAVACRSAERPPPLASVSPAASGPNAPSPAPSIASSSGAAKTAAPSNTPAARQLSRWLSAFNAGDRAELLSYHQEAFPYAAASSDVADIDLELRLREGTGGFVVRTQQQTAANRIVVVLQERKRDGFARVEMEVDAVAPHRVKSFVIGPIPMPSEFRSPDEPTSETLTAANRAWLVDAIARKLEAHYVFPETAQRMTADLRSAAARGDYDRVEKGADFARLVQQSLRAGSRDLHLRFEFMSRPLPRSTVASPTKDADERVQRWRKENFRFGAIERLKGNVARVEIFNFLPPDPPVREAVAGFMSQVADADALIFDLRTNRGGSPETVAFVASYVFDSKPVHLNDMFRRDDGTTKASWTLVEVPGKRFGAHKPVYILTSAETFSGGEEFAYDLQSLGRALVIGETTGGGANPTENHDIGALFRLSVPWGRPINPITKTNWEGVGVKPDVSVSAEAALERALQCALKDLAASKR